MSEQPPDRHHKISHWDRPKPPRDWRWVVGGIGRILITVGLLLFAFVGYQLWGTGIQTAQAQRTLAADFDESLAGLEATPSTSTTVPTTTDPAPADSIAPAASTTTIAPTTTTAPVLASAKPIPLSGEAVARLEIPRMGLNSIVVEGATADDLTKGPGHFPETPLPGQLGNAAIAGHRTTYLAPFFDIDKLQPGDEIIVTTLNGRYVYRVTGTEIVAPEDYAAVIPTTDATKATLALVSCTPRYTAKNRIIVRAELAQAESDAMTEPNPVEAVVDLAEPGVTLPSEELVTVPAGAPTVEPATTAPASTASAGSAPADSVPLTSAGPAAASPDAFTDGWFSDKSAIPQAILWGLALAAVAFAIYWVSRMARRYWVGVLGGFAPFIVVLYFFFENVNRLLPPNL